MRGQLILLPKDRNSGAQQESATSAPPHRCTRRSMAGGTGTQAGVELPTRQEADGSAKTREVKLGHGADSPDKLE
jgi:hypothetical protein